MSGILRIGLICLLVGGCSVPGPFRTPAAPPPDTPAQPATGAEPARPAPTRPAPTLPATTIASLGDVARPGLWMRTPLVTAPRRGRVSDPATGRAVVLDLLPLDAAPGAGSRMSLAAYQQLGLPLTALPELRVEPTG